MRCAFEEAQSSDGIAAGTLPVSMSACKAEACETVPCEAEAGEAEVGQTWRGEGTDVAWRKIGNTHEALPGMQRVSEKSGEQLHGTRARSEEVGSFPQLTH